MVTQIEIAHLNNLLIRAGSDARVELREDGPWLIGNFESARQKVATYKLELSRQEETMADTSVDQFWALTDKTLDAHPGLSLAAARFETMARHPELAAAAGVPGAAKVQRRAKPAENSRHYYDEFFSRAAEIEKQTGCTFEESRLRCAAQFPALRLAAFSQDPRERFQAARRFENEVNGLGLQASHQAAAIHLAKDVTEVAL